MNNWISAAILMLICSIITLVRVTKKIMSVIKGENSYTEFEKISSFVLVIMAMVLAIMAVMIIIKDI